MERFQLQPEGDGAVGRVYEAPSVAEIRIGRDEAAMRAEAAGRAAGPLETLVVDGRNAMVSSYHARVYFDAKSGSFFLEGRGRNGTFHNGKRVVDNASVKLRGGDLIRLAKDGPSYRFNQRVAAPAIPATAPDPAGPSPAAGREPAPPGGTVELVRHMLGRAAGSRTVELFRGAMQRVVEKRIGGRIRAVYAVVAVAILSGGGWSYHMRQVLGKVIADSGRTAAGLREQLDKETELGRQEVARLKREIAAARKAAVEGGDGVTLDATVQRSVFQIGIAVGPKGGTAQKFFGLGSGFAVRVNAIATNAHVALALREAAETIDRNSGGKAAVLAGYALHSGTSDERCQFDLADMRVPSDYDKSASMPKAFYKDISIVRTSCSNLAPLKILDAAELAAFENGRNVGIVGFPGMVSEVTNSVDASVTKGNIVSRDARLVIDDAVVTHGSSGSPILNARHEVVGVNAGYWIRNGEDFRYGVGVAAPVLNDYLASEGF